jgi:endonuclease YncB( thermonuclease family)
MTLEVQGQRLRLFGIDAPDLKQTCRWPNKVIPCG